MIAKPTTEQILNDCSRELMDVVLPAVADDTVKVTVMMMELVLRNMAVRAAHEIAWMTDEIAELTAFAAGPDGSSPASADGSLHLDDVVERYREASDAFSRAMEKAVASGDEERTRRGAAIMSRRLEHEQEVMCGWSPVGR
jgi:hypothetical protein